MRHLKYHEQKLLRKVNLLEWKGTSTAREQAVTNRFKIEERETYVLYNGVVGKIRRLALALAKLNDNDETKTQVSKDLAQRLYVLGLVPAKSLLECSKVSVSSFCKRRLSTVLATTKMVPDIATAVTFVTHGHVKVGTRVVTEPGFLINRAMEDYITWREESKVREAIETFKDK
ncbi:U3 small nucleolar ribonucleoprotein IMP3 [Nematocida displodere]|uniref:U3 small nucleolar ribonucleoprotein IMP3 n=1 Tax=Nematocida displodere TaxID=1805483 RepID=A0A177EAW0_9MICR|nr:U3 small nucleolar ribonucleoprotein IMP3 [Nematocida displodere]